jgi:hypothetical protein
MVVWVSLFVVVDSYLLELRFGIIEKIVSKV